MKTLAVVITMNGFTPTPMTSENLVFIPMAARLRTRQKYDILAMGSDAEFDTWHHFSGS